jgi:NADH-quinone oxidoreductase subunit J
MITVLFIFFAVIAIGGALGVVLLARSPVGSLLFMVTTLAAMAGIFVLLEAHFLAAIQIIVYAGAIMVLFLFVIMLLNLGHDYVSDLKGGVLAILSFAAIGGIGGVLVRNMWGEDLPVVAAGGRAIDAAVREHGAVGAIAEPLYTTYVVPFEITGILLLVAIVGALVLAKRHVQ